MYVPDLSTTGEELKLAPVDEQEEQRKQQLMAETYKVEQEILSERDKEGGAGLASSEMSEKELTKNIILYLREMADGELEEAQRVAELIVPCRTRAVKIIDEIALSEIPEPELADIPQQVLAGLIRKLRVKIS